MYPVRCKHLNPVLTALQVTAAGSSVTINEGSNDFSSAAFDGGISPIIMQLREAGLFARQQICLGTLGGAADLGGVFSNYQSSSPTLGQIYGELFNHNSTADTDGKAHVVGLGFGSADTDRYEDAQTVRATWNAPQLLAWRITNNGTVAIASGGRQASVARSATGVVTLTLTPARARLRAALAMPVSATAASCVISASSGSSLTIKTASRAGAAVDCDFIVFGFYSGNSDESGRVLDILRCAQIGAELVIGKVDQTGTRQIGGATNGVDFTCVRNGAGDYTVTLAKAGLRAVLPMVTTDGWGAQLLATPTTSAFQVGTFNGSGVAADNGFSFACLVYNADSSLEF